jgi:hypothetical protein
MRKNPTKLEQLQQDNDELIQALEDIGGLADEADDAALDRAAIIEKIRAISERVDDEIESDDDGPDAGE